MEGHPEREERDLKIDQVYEVVRIDGDHDPLKEHPQNPNEGDDDSVDESVDVNGWYGAVVAQKSTGYILAGNTRYRVAKRKDAKEIPVIWRDVDDDTAMRIMLADNQTARRAEMDEEKLTAILQELGDIKGTGYDSALHRLETEEDPPEPEPVGDVSTAPASNGGPVDPDDIPDDKYTPAWGVMVVCTSEADQGTVFQDVQRAFPNHTLRVVAV